jgi:hypothetical protein
MEQKNPLPMVSLVPKTHWLEAPAALFCVKIMLSLNSFEYNVSKNVISIEALECVSGSELLDVSNILA